MGNAVANPDPAIAPLNPEPFGTFRLSWLWRARFGRRDLGQPAQISPSRAQRLRSLFQKKRPVFDVTHDGLDLRLYPAENLCDRKLAIFGTHPVHEDISLAAAALTKARVFVDIGANIGLYSLMARKLMPPDSRLVVFEPDPRTVRKLRQNLDFNHADNVTVINAAVGARNEVLTLYNASPKNFGRNSLKEPATDGQETRGTEVQVRPLHEALTECDVEHVDVLKIDVEGFEAEALAPFLETAPDSLLPHYIMIEVKSRAEWRIDLLAQFRARGYHTVHETEDDMHLVRRSDGVLSETSNSAIER
jgi:FkbM family methyltransferase